MPPVQKTFDLAPSYRIAHGQQNGKTRNAGLKAVATGKSIMTVSVGSPA